jgi:hypothetical protein
MSYTFTPWHTGLVAHIGDLDSDGAFYVEARPCVGYVTVINRYRGEEQAQTALAVLDDEFPYVVQPLDALHRDAPTSVVVAVLPVGDVPTAEQVAQAERLSRQLLGATRHAPRAHTRTASGRTAA